MLIPSTHLPENMYRYLFSTSRRIVIAYFLVVSVFVITIATLPYIYIDIAVVAPGMIRPSNEKTEIKSAVTGYIQAIHFKDGDIVSADGVITSLSKEGVVQKNQEIASQLSRLRNNITDLQLLVAASDYSRLNHSALKTSLYQHQLLSFRHRLAEQQISVTKSLEELRINSYLHNEKVISGKELFDKEMEAERSIMANNYMSASQKAAWQQDLDHSREQYEALLSEQKQLAIESLGHQVKAPITGSIQFPIPRYPGSFIQSGETVAIISPEDDLLAECLVTGRDIALIKSAEKVLLKIDAFNYSYFGMLTGKISSIDKDISIIDNKPVFRVRCTLNKNELTLRNGFTGKIQKGLTLQANFIVNRRSLWQLLFDTVDDWLNPRNRSNNI